MLKQVGRSGEQRHVSPRNAQTNGIPRERSRAQIGHLPGTPDDDQV